MSDIPLHVDLSMPEKYNTKAAGKVHLTNTCLTAVTYYDSCQLFFCFNSSQACHMIGYLQKALYRDKIEVTSRGEVWHEASSPAQSWVAPR